MSFFPCKNWSDCVPPAEGVAVRNLSSEGPDVPSFFGFYQCDTTGTNPPFANCTSIISQAQADACAAACLPRGVYVNTLLTGTSACGVAFTAPPGMFLGVSVQAANATALAYALAAANKLCQFSNTAQNCVVTCADSSSQNYTVPAGAIKAATLAAANSAAMALACETAALQCFGALVSNEGQTCSVVCSANGGTISFTVPAGVVHHLSLAAANARALEIACTLAMLSCSELPDLIGNDATSCSQTCLGETISNTIPAGAFVAVDKLSANNIAFIFCALTLAQACAEEDFPPESMNVGSQFQSATISC